MLQQGRGLGVFMGIRNKHFLPIIQIDTAYFEHLNIVESGLVWLHSFNFYTSSNFYIICICITDTEIACYCSFVHTTLVREFHVLFPIASA